MSCISNNYRPPEHDYQINESIELRASLMVLQTHYTAHPLCVLAQINCDVKPQFIWEEYKCNFVDFNSEIFSFGNLTIIPERRRQQSNKNRRYFVDWLINWLILFVRLLVLGQIGHWLLGFGRRDFFFFLSILLIPVLLAVATITNHPLGNIFDI